MKKASADNTFLEGLVMDFNPISTPNNVLVGALNATLLTANGNENVLLNDMGNGRVETAYLPEGYVPLGTCSLGGIIYIVSYNPLTDKCLIGSFPSPERNISTDEKGDPNVVLNCSAFYGNSVGSEWRFITAASQKAILTSDITLHPGDKFLIYCPLISDANGIISAYNQSDFNTSLWPKYLKFNIVSITDDGKMTNLNDTLTWLPVGNKYYYIRNTASANGEKADIDEYRSLIGSNYSVFLSKTSGKLGIVLELECIDSFDVAWDALKNENNWDIYLYTNWTYENDYAPDKINLYGVYYKTSISEENTTALTDVEENVIIIDNYPRKEKERIALGSTDIFTYKDPDNIYFLNPLYTTNTLKVKDEPITEDGYLMNLSIRANDGTDNLFLITKPISVTAPDKNAKNDSILTLEIAPAMPYGILEWMKLSIRINLSKLGTGEINLVLYRYYVENSTILLNWGLEAYPELNKSINKVTFSFYPLNEDNLKVITEAPKVNEISLFDSGRYIEESNQWEYKEDNKWILQSGKALSLTNKLETPYISVENQTSYSGYFSETISRVEGLTTNQVYIILIAIDYNKEKTINYYRIFYNAPIFNSYFFTKNDFKDILLNDVIEELLLYKLSNNTAGTISLDWKDGEPPNTLDELDENFKDYTLTSTYVGTDTGIISATVGEVFKATVSNALLDGEGGNELDATTSDIDTYSDDAEAALISTSSLSGTISLDKITCIINKDKITANNNTITTKFDFSLAIPFKILYGNKTVMNVPYELVHIKSTLRWMIYRGRDKYHMLGLYQDLTSIGKGSSYETRDLFGDDTQISGSFEQSYSNCCSLISTLLDTYDVVVLPSLSCRGLTEDGNKKGKPSAELGFGNSGNNLTEGNGYTEYRGVSDTNLGRLGCGIFYAMKNSIGSVVLFSVQPNSSQTLYGIDSSDNEDVGTLAVTNADGCMRATINNMYKSYLTYNEIKKDDAVPPYMCPLKGYYKPIEYTGNSSKFTYSRILYYPSFTAAVTHNILGAADLELSTNEIIIKPELVIKNLSYKAAHKFNFSYNTSWGVNTTDKVIYLTEIGTSIFTLTPTGLQERQVSKNCLYTSEGNTVSKMAQWTMNKKGVEDISNRTSISKGLTFEVVDEMVRIKTNLSNISKYMTGHCEEQNICIRSIPIIK